MAVPDGCPSARLRGCTEPGPQADSPAARPRSAARWTAGGRLKTVPASRQQGKPYRGRAISLTAPRKLLRILTVPELLVILAACARLRGRFFAVARESGRPAGEVPGLRHEDIAAAWRLCGGRLTEDPAPRSITATYCNQGLFISENTVKNHVRNVLEKLQIHSRMEAFMIAMREKLIEPG